MATLDFTIQDVIVAWALVRVVEHPGEGIEVHLHVNNRTDRPLTIDADSLELTSADFVVFEQPDLDPPARIEVPPDEARMIIANFIYPDDPAVMDLRSLGLLLTLNLYRGREPISRTITFERERRLGEARL